MLEFNENIFQDFNVLQPLVYPDNVFNMESTYCLSMEPVVAVPLSEESRRSTPFDNIPPISEFDAKKVMKCLFVPSFAWNSYDFTIHERKCLVNGDCRGYYRCKFYRSKDCRVRLLVNFSPSNDEWQSATTDFVSLLIILE